MANRTIVRILGVAAAVAMATAGCTARTPAAPVPAPAPTSTPMAIPAPDSDRCPVTIANGNGPPGERPSPDFHGNGKLWTALPPNGIDRGGTPEPDGSTSQKYPWWTVGTEGGIAIAGRRLDAPAPTPLRARVNSGEPATPFAEVPGGRFWSSGLSFPTAGCWQVTARVGATSLTFVVLVPNRATPPGTVRP
jgi:hypothetical protein